MSGIYGFNWNDKCLARKMNDAMKHRGPDHAGVLADVDITLGHLRMGTIDTSDNSHQPIASEKKDVYLTLNGEIHNLKELRTELEAKGYTFTGDSAAEVVLYGYEEYGTDILKKLCGMFAFAIWDSNKKQIFIARDRIGVKPLYYWLKEEKLIFASEIKAILECPLVERRLNKQALYDYIGFEFVPSPNTMFQGINKLPPGSYILLKNGQLTQGKYWDLQMGSRKDISLSEAIEGLREQLDIAVKTQFPGDIPFGAFLSGGLDSSALVAMMRKHITGPLKTFTIGYHDKSFSELDYAEIVAKHFGTEHTVLMIDDLKPEYIEKAVWHLDEPMTDLSAIPLFLICRQARQHVAVCFSGEGSDESFAGYDRFKAAKIDRAYALLPKRIRSIVSKAASQMADRPQKKGAINMLKRFLQGSDLPKEGAHLRWQYFSDQTLEARLFPESFREGIIMDPFRLVREHLAACSYSDKVNQEIYLDTRFMMADSVLMKVDRMCTAASLGVRVPFLDYKFVEYVASLPGWMKLKGFTTKYVLRKALTGILPSTIVYRGKQGYSLPVKQLLRGRLKQYMIELLNESDILRHNFNMEQLNIIIDEHISMRQNHNHILWALINVAVWGNIFLGKQHD